MEKQIPKSNYKLIEEIDNDSIVQWLTKEDDITIDFVFGGAMKQPITKDKFVELLQDCEQGMTTQETKFLSYHQYYLVVDNKKIGHTGIMIKEKTAPKENHEKNCFHVICLCSTRVKEVWLWIINDGTCI
eukprot:TRINITY_DN3838_c0_g1_i1.p2 TRINITY_DN3838_c0_g1~~TRINITY_DN3838_c0_g1_i1.p2  ORF type:complete len:130 (-),score=28.92 TRINITY_DN3838_c0_g1_i1:391-780(-)